MIKLVTKRSNVRANVEPEEFRNYFELMFKPRDKNTPDHSGNTKTL